MSMSDLGSDIMGGKKLVSSVVSFLDLVCVLVWEKTNKTNKQTVR